MNFTDPPHSCKGDLHWENNKSNYSGTSTLRSAKGWENWLVISTVCYTEIHFF